ncbi:hypothetical protein GN244_ATG19543 [Phytophthora infestans]|uniref:Uncharacterized protein n=1 Tax=Phytophthora infestans TaxID=4787 RepID=A0A833VU48_PHYIN|nr:hypothetical protein GN244_ATG19543 [Phytophthora infestans]
MLLHLRERILLLRVHAGQQGEARMALLERAARRHIGCMIMRLVAEMSLPSQHAVAAAERMKDMRYEALSVSFWVLRHFGQRCLHFAV